MTEYDFTRLPSLSFVRSTIWPEKGSPITPDEAGIERQTQRQEFEGPNGEHLVYERWFSCGPWTLVSEPTSCGGPSSEL